MGAQARRRAQQLRQAKETAASGERARAVRVAGRAHRLYAAAERGEINEILQWTCDPRQPRLRLLLHALLRYRGLEETVFLHVLRWCPEAARTPDREGWYPLHLLCYLTYRPTPLMLRVLCAAGPVAAKLPTSTGWIPLQLLCQQAQLRCCARATPAALAAVRHAYPDGAQTYLPAGTEWGDRLPMELLPKDLPALEQCKRALACAEPQLGALAAQHRSLDLAVRGVGRRRCEAACASGDAPAVVGAVRDLDRLTGCIADAPDGQTGCVLLHDIVSRCGRTLDDWALGACVRAYPAAAFHADKRGNLPLHLLLANGACHVTLAQVQSLVGLHPLSLQHKGARGWTPLHAFCARPPRVVLVAGLNATLAVLRYLLRGVVGRKAARVRDANGDLPLHLLAYACTDARDAKLTHLGGGEDVCVEWGAAFASTLCETLMRAYPPAWRLAGSKGATACDAAPAELHDVLMGAATAKGRSSLSDVSRAVARMLPKRREALSYFSLEKLVALGADEALQKRLRVQRHREPETIPMDLLHLLLKRDEDVGNDILRAVVDAGGAGSCALRDGDGWLPLHLIARRAPGDQKITAGQVRRVLAYHRPALLCRGGAEKLCPLAAFAVALSTGSQRAGASLGAGNSFSDEPLAHWRERCLGVCRALCESAPQARVVPSGDGDVACALLPASSDYDALRAAMRPQHPAIELNEARPVHLQCKHVAPRRPNDEDADVYDAPALRRLPEPGAVEMTRCLPLAVHLDPLADPLRPDTAASDAPDFRAYFDRPATREGGAPRPTTAGGTLRATTPGGSVLVRESIETQNLKRGRPRTPQSPGGSRLYATPRGTRMMRPLTGGGSARPLTPGGSIRGPPVDAHGVRRPKTPRTQRRIEPCTPGGTFRPTTRGGTLLRRSDRHELPVLNSQDDMAHSPHRRSDVSFADEPRSFDAPRSRQGSGPRRPGSRKRCRRERAAAAEAVIAGGLARKQAEVDARAAAAQADVKVERRRRRKEKRQQRHDRLDAFMGLPRLTPL